MRIPVRSTDDLQAIIHSAPAGAQLVLTPGEYAGNYVLDKPLELTGDGSGGAVTLSAQQGSCLRVTEPRTIIWGLTLGAGSRFATLLNIETNDVTIDECVLHGGETAARICGKNITLNRCEMRNSNVGLYLDECGDVDIVDCMIQKNIKTGVLCRNLYRDTRLIACELAHNGATGLATSYYEDNRRRFGVVNGPRLFDCAIHHNAVYGLSITDETQYTYLQGCRVYDNTKAQIHHRAQINAQLCDIAGGEIGILIEGGIGSEMHTCRIHDMPIGVLSTKPHVGKQEYTIFYSSRFYNTTEAACRTSDGGILHFLGCVIRDNKHIGLDVGAGCKHELKQCRLARNSFGIVVRPSGFGTIDESIINQNATGTVVTSGGEIDVTYSRIENHSGIAVVLEEASKSRFMDTLFRSNAAGDMSRHPLAKADIVGDPQRDYLAERMRHLGFGIRIPLE